MNHYSESNFKVFNNSWHIKKTTLYSFLIFFTIFLSTLYLSGFYVSGDQLGYIKLYEASKGQSLPDIYLKQILTVGSADIGFSIILWIFSDLLPKNIFMSISNGILSVLMFKLTVRLNYPKWFFIGLILSFYTLILFFAAERLKFASIILTLAFFYKTLFYRTLIILVASIFHIQSLFALFILLIYEISRKDFFKKSLKPKNILTLSFMLPFLIFFIMAVYEFLLIKILAYLSFDLFNLVKPLLLGFILITLIPDKFFAIVITIFFLLACLILGTERVIMMQFIFTLFSINPNNNLNALVLLILFAYLQIKSVEFVLKFIACGEGFLCQIF